MARKKRKPLEIIRTKAWYGAIAQASGCQEPARIAEFMGDRSGCDDERLWRRYRRGEVSPSTATLNSVERRLAGTLDVYKSGPDGSHLWAALDHKTPGLERYRLIQESWELWSETHVKLDEVQRWIDYWPPRSKYIHEIYDEAPSILVGLSHQFPLHALAIGYHLWHSVAIGLLAAIPTMDILPMLKCVLSVLPLAEDSLKHYGISRSDLLAVSDPLETVGEAREILPQREFIDFDETIHDHSVDYGPELGSMEIDPED